MDESYWIFWILHVQFLPESTQSRKQQTTRMKKKNATMTIDSEATTQEPALGGASQTKTGNHVPGAPAAERQTLTERIIVVFKLTLIFIVFEFQAYI